LLNYFQNFPKLLFDFYRAIINCKDSATFKGDL
jgi:hypothetical protein